MPVWPKPSKKLEYFIHPSDPFYMHGVPRQGEKGEVDISWYPFLKQYKTDGVQFFSMQLGRSMTIQRFNAMMNRHSRFLHRYPRNQVRISLEDAPRLIEMAEWCSYNVSGGFSGWTCRYLNDELGIYDSYTLEFCFVFKKHAAQFKLTFA